MIRKNLQLKFDEENLQLGQLTKLETQQRAERHRVIPKSNQVTKWSAEVSRLKDQEDQLKTKENETEILKSELSKLKKELAKHPPPPSQAQAEENLDTSQNLQLKDGLEQVETAAEDIIDEATIEAKSLIFLTFLYISSFLNL
ncbi:coiled-coil domain-containing protein 27 [Lasius niger]|uniref:Coiled-coil domain-containing protein 27 n=1 Tax=Lasius niger TaxID=67767 RepID=A0A0J7K5D9_LASNI|nr:coiled-coil domain-containing protein 27 [Lasius niger]